MNIYSHENQFINNKYTNWYYAIIIAAELKNRKKLKRDNTDFVYFERHHILPVCWFPQYKKEKWNLVLLTAREHFICHRLLTKMTTGYFKHKMTCAIIGLLRKNNNQDRWIPNSKVYQYIKEELSKSFSTIQTGKRLRPQTEAEKLKKSLSMKGKNTGPRSAESIAKQVNTMTGKKRAPHTEQARANISAALTGRRYEDIFNEDKNLEIKAKISLTHKGKVKKKVICPHCSKVGGIPVMKRFHFDQCKINIQKAMLCE